MSTTTATTPARSGTLTALRLAWHVRRREAGEQRRLTVLSVTAFAVTTAAVMTTLAGVKAFTARADGLPPQDVANAYPMLAWVAVALMVVPVLTLGAVAARLDVSRRDARLASLRLVGATSGQVVTMTLAEAGLQALTGALAGTVAYVVSIPLWSFVSFQGRGLGPDEMWLGAPAMAAVVVGVVVVALASGASGVSRVVISPLGVAQRTTPRRLRATRVLLAGALVAGWLVAFQARGDIGLGVLLVALAGVMCAMNVVGPFLVMVAGHLLARGARTPETLLAARRIVDDPRATWRSVAALGLGVTVAGLSAVGSALSAAAEDGDAATRLLGADIGTGALVALGIIAVVAATSTGVVQAARVLDQRPQYRALALAGAPLELLHRARTREVGLPLAVTVVLASAFPVLILLPMSSYIGPGLFLRVTVAVVAACGLTLAALTASRVLVTRAARA